MSYDGVRTTTMIAILIALCAIVWLLKSDQRGRYQVVMPVLVDTATGETWYYRSDSWTPIEKVDR